MIVAWSSVLGSGQIRYFMNVLKTGSLGHDIQKGTSFFHLKMWLSWHRRPLDSVPPTAWDAPPNRSRGEERVWETPRPRALGSPHPPRAYLHACSA